MIPWNPIHRYAGMTSHFDELDELAVTDVPQARFTSWGDDPQPAQPERTPLGFVDVRAEAASNDDADEFVLAAATGDDDPAQQTEEKVPFFKREISFGRKRSSDAEPTAAETPAEVEIPVNEIDAEEIDTKEIDAVPPVEVAAEAEETERVPFYKREIGFGRKSKTETETEIEIDGETQAEPVELPVAEEVFVPQATEPALEVLADEPQVETPAEPEAETVAPVFELPAREELEPVAVAAFEPTVAGADEPFTPEPDAPVEPVVELEPVADAAGESDTEASAKVPLHKRELSFGKNGKQKPSQKKSRGGGGGRKTGRKLVGLKIGASQLAAAVVQQGDNGFELLELGRTPLEPGIVLDGEVRDPDALAAALRTFFADQKLPTRDVRIGVASNRIGVRTFEIDGIEDGARFDNAVRFKAHEVLPIAASDSVLDYRVLEERHNEAGETIRRILLVVAPRDQVVPYVEVAQRAGLRLAGIDLEALGLMRAFVAPTSERQAGDTSTVVVSIGHEASTLLVSGAGVCEFTRVFDWGGATLQEAIAQELDVHPAEAATILRHLSLSGNSPRVEGIDEDARNRAIEAVRLRLTPFARELVSSLQFYQTQPESLGIGEIVITGGTSQLDGLGDALHQMIGVQVRVGDPLGRVTVRNGAEAGFEQSLGSLAVPIGLAIDDDPTRSVDLSPGDVAVQGRRRNLAPILIPAAAVVPLAALGLLFSQAHGKVSQRESDLAGAQTALAALPQPHEPQIDAALQGAEAARASAVAQVLGNRTSWDGMLRDLSRVLPANVWLTGLKAAVPVPLSVPIAVPTAATPGATTQATTAPVAPTGVTITGYTFAHPDVAVLLGRLVALPTLTNVQLVASTETQLGKKNVIQFTILANLSGVGGGA